MNRFAKLPYKAMEMAVGILGGALAGVIFKRVWKLISNGPDAPAATDRERTWHDVLVAAAIHGAVYGTVRALVDRAGAKGFERVTGEWPDS